MAKKPALLPSLSRPVARKPVPLATAPQRLSMRPSKQWLLFSSLLVFGLILLSVATFAASGWLTNVKNLVFPAPTQAPIQTINIQHTAPYAGLTITILTAQYTPIFADDPIHSGPAVVRLNMKITNPTSDQINIIYYDIARLLTPKQNPLPPSNVRLSVSPKPGTSETGWIDFSVPQGLELSTLKLQLGSSLLSESLVTIPFSGTFNAANYSDRSSPQSLTINYYFPYYRPQHLLIYHLTSIDIRYAYHGLQCKSGQQYYILNFSVDNPNTIPVDPGYGFDYVRLVFSGTPHSPLDSTLPYGFNANAKDVHGRVIFTGPQGLHSLTIDLLYQYGSGGNNYTVSL